MDSLVSSFARHAVYAAWHPCAALPYSQDEGQEPEVGGGEGEAGDLGCCCHKSSGLSGGQAGV